MQENSCKGQKKDVKFFRDIFILRSPVKKKYFFEWYLFVVCPAVIYAML